jgi:hypothetical protein
MTRGIAHYFLTTAAVLAVQAGAAAQSCPWSPWMAEWGHLDSYKADPPDQDLDPSNWDYLGIEPTILDGDGRAHTGNYAFHFFSGNPVSPGSPSGWGSGGVYQEVQAVRGTPIDVSVWWKGAAPPNGGWFEVMVFEGPFTTAKADNGPPDPADIIMKRDTFGGFPPPSATWVQQAASWNNWSAPTPAEPTTVTVVLKAGAIPEAQYFEAYFDDLVVTQGGGPNLVTNADFEDPVQALNCQHVHMARDPDRDNYYFGIPSPEVCDSGMDEDGDTLIDCADPDCAEELHCQCNTPFADMDGDGDVDHDDFAIFQRCYTGSGLGPVALECRCLDRPEPLVPDGDIDEVDFVAFLKCVSGPTVPADEDCENQ